METLWSTMWTYVSPGDKGGVKDERFVPLGTIISNLPTELLEPGCIVIVQKALGSGSAFPSAAWHLHWHRRSCSPAAAWEAAQAPANTRKAWLCLKGNHTQLEIRCGSKVGGCHGGAALSWALGVVTARVGMEWEPKGAKVGCQRASANPNGKGITLFCQNAGFLNHSSWSKGCCYRWVAQ